MAKSAKSSKEQTAKKSKAATAPAILKGWEQIASFLGQPVKVAQRWARTDEMPITRQGRYVVATPEELNRWLGHESGGEPLRVATPEVDLAAELKRGLAYVRDQKSPERVKKKSSK